MINILSQNVDLIDKLLKIFLQWIRLIIFLTSCSNAKDQIGSVEIFDLSSFELILNPIKHGT